jgi:hypothetical protein
LIELEMHKNLPSPVTGEWNDFGEWLPIDSESWKTGYPAQGKKGQNSGNGGGAGGGQDDSISPDGSVGGPIHSGGGGGGGGTSAPAAPAQPDIAALSALYLILRNMYESIAQANSAKYDPEGDTNPLGSATSGSPIRPHGQGPASDGGEQFGAGDSNPLLKFAPELADRRAVLNLPDAGDSGRNVLTDSLVLHGPGIASLNPEGSNPHSGALQHFGIRDPRDPAGRPNPDGTGPVGPAARSWLAW